MIHQQMDKLLLVTETVVVLLVVLLCSRNSLKSMQPFMTKDRETTVGRPIM